MTRFPKLLLCLAIVLLVATGTALADSFTLADGTDTISFSVPNQPARGSFTPDCSEGTCLGFYFNEVAITVDGTALSTPYTVEFYTKNDAGGMAIFNIATGDNLVNNYGAVLPGYTGDQGQKVYSGSVFNPTFLAGVYQEFGNGPGSGIDYMNGNSTLTISDADPNSSTITPEPSSVLFLGTGIVGCLGAMRRKFAR